MLKKHLNLSLLRYVIAGLGSFAFELSFAIFLHSVLGLHRTLSTSIAFWFAVLVSFLLQKLFTFRNYEKQFTKLATQGTGYSLLVVCNYLFTVLIVSIFSDSNFILARIFALGCTTIWNYFLYKNVIFGDKKLFRAFTINNKLLARRAAYFLLLSVPIVIFMYQYAFTGNKMMGGDFDYYAQFYEAFRISVLKFHQFPFWNPWMSGGMPLFANPQFGTFSLQSILALIFGATYGLKLAYVCYAIAGFWGMYAIGTRILSAPRLRSALVSYIWVFCGFFAWHGMSHFTFALFFLFPWQVYFIHKRHEKHSWIYFGLIEAIIINSSVHYAFLMTALALSVFFLVSIIDLKASKVRSRLSMIITFTKQDVLFVLKTTGLILLLSAYRFILTLGFVQGNSRILDMTEHSEKIKVLIGSVFLPIGNWMGVPDRLQYGWVEYNMYIGLGAGFALIIILLSFARRKFRLEFSITSESKRFLIGCSILGVIGIMLALGDFSKLSPFNMLQQIPGFTQTRVPSRWIIMLVFPILVCFLAWKKNTKLVNILLFASIIELFIFHGPITHQGKDQVYLPKTTFSSELKQFDSGRRHHDYMSVIDHSYTYNTSRNFGSIDSDDPLLNTLNAFVGTSKCGINVLDYCDLVLSDNATISYWSPNQIIVKRTSSGPIKLNINKERNWRVNDEYPFANEKRINPVEYFVIPDGKVQTYDLVYAPKLSPAWWSLKLHKIQL